VIKDFFGSGEEKFGHCIAIRRGMFEHPVLEEVSGAFIIQVFYSGILVPA